MTKTDFLAIHTVVVNSPLIYGALSPPHPGVDHFFRFLAAIPTLATLRVFPSALVVSPVFPSVLRRFTLTYFHTSCLDDRSIAFALSSTGDDQPDYAIHINLVSTICDISHFTVLTIGCFLPTLDNLAKQIPDPNHLDLGPISGPPLLTPEEISLFPSQVPNLTSTYVIDPFETVGIMQGLPSWLAEDRAGLPLKLETLQLLRCSTGNEDMLCVEGIRVCGRSRWKHVVDGEKECIGQGLLYSAYDSEEGDSEVLDLLPCYDAPDDVLEDETSRDPETSLQIYQHTLKAGHLSFESM
ncbi:hypothetical protein EDB19DRAFT_2038071 [Suillus lakei]|nr:hypothetical protein EDB19DRAFT_2038071 [Suillus lakei]